jgi:hypothetical protein
MTRRSLEIEMSSSPRNDDIVEEGRAVVQAATDSGLTLRLFGGVGIHARCGTRRDALAREYHDLDFVAPKRASQRVAALFQDRGYVGDAELNGLHGHFRLWFYDEALGRRADVFVGQFEMCHTLPLASRLTVDDVTLPLADLLLTKLQIVEMNDKDQRDLLTLILANDVGSDDRETINGDYIARLCSQDWGLWRTCTQNLARLVDVVSTYELSPGDPETVRRRVSVLSELISGARKSLSWKARAAIGDRLQWYELPEEPTTGGI